jgi:hypothetical protein
LSNSLSVCCLTDAPGEQIRAIFGPLREVADEIVIAADSRVGEPDLAGYRAVADRVLPRDVAYFEPHLRWLHEQCTGDWILRLDGDEVPSRALVEQLPQLIASDEINQYWLPRSWIDPSGEGWLAELPWSPDYHNRLVRNDDSLAFTGNVHTEAAPVFPSRYLDLPLYHLLCALESRKQRHARGLLYYELREPGRVAPGGGPFNATYYLPERFARRGPIPLPAQDRPAVDAALRRTSSPRTIAPNPPPRDDGPALRLLEPDLRLYAGEARGIFVEVRNHDEVRWPGRFEDEPRVRLSYHWRGGDGSMLVFDGERTQLPAPLAPGAKAIAPVTVVAPSEPGSYRLEIDLVEEGVRWLGREVAAEVEVVPPGLTERNVPRGLQRMFGRRRIPRVLHRVWLGSEPMPEARVRMDVSWQVHHPDWEHRLWTDADLTSLGVSEQAIAKSRDASELSDLVRYHVLAQHGGVYVDTDLECVRPLDPLLRGTDAFAAFQAPGAVSNAVIGAVPEHPALSCAVELARLALERESHLRRTGSWLLTHVLWDFPDVTLFPPDSFSSEREPTPGP